MREQDSSRTVRLTRAAIALRGGAVLVSRGMGCAAGWAFVACALLIGLEVVLRNAFGVSTQSTTELSGYLLACGISWGLAHALAARSHVRIDAVLTILPLRARALLHLVALAILCVFVGFVAYGAVQLALESHEFGATDISLLRTPLAVPQGLWAAGLCVFFLLIALTLAEVALLLAAGDWLAVDAFHGPRTYKEEAEEAVHATSGVAGDLKTGGAALR